MIASGVALSGECFWRDVSIQARCGNKSGLESGQQATGLPLEEILLAISCVTST